MLYPPYVPIWQVAVKPLFCYGPLPSHIDFAELTFEIITFIREPDSSIYVCQKCGEWIPVNHHFILQQHVNEKHTPENKNL